MRITEAVIRKTVASNIRLARDEMELTQRELARVLNDIPVQLISRWERGETMPAIKSLATLCRRSGHSPAWFFTPHNKDES